MNNETDLLNFFKNLSLIEIKSKNIDEIKKFFEENNINNENSDICNEFYEVLKYLIDVSSSEALIKFIIGLQSDWGKYLSFYNAVKDENFKLANTLLKYDEFLNEEYQENKYWIYGCESNNHFPRYYEVVKDLQYNNCLTKKNLQYLLNYGYPNIINPYIFCQLIRENQNDLLKYILDYQPENKKYFINNILNEYLIGSYKNKIPLTDKQILKIKYNTKEGNHYNVDKSFQYGCGLCGGRPCEYDDDTDSYTPLAYAYLYNNTEAVNLLLNYGEINNINYYFENLMNEMRKKEDEDDKDDEDDEDDEENEYFYDDDLLMGHDQFIDYDLMINIKIKKNKSKIKDKRKYIELKLIKNKNKKKYHNKISSKLEIYLI